MIRRSLVESVLGVTDPTNKQQSLNQAHLTLTGEYYDAGYYTQRRQPLQKEQRSAWWNGLTQNDRERWQALRSITDVLFGRQLTIASTLTDWPIYRQFMGDFGAKADGSASALMIGSYTSLSSRSFTCLAQEEYGADKAVIVDPVAGRDKLRHGWFVYGSGLALPLRQGSMDFVHTNHLLQALFDPSSKVVSKQEQMLRLAHEIARVIRPGGQVLMKEVVPNYKTFDLTHPADFERARETSATLGMFMATALIDHGLNCKLAWTDQVSNKAFLFDSERNFDRYGVTPSPTTFGIYARKPV